jgi:hypothetical protein
MKAAAKSRCGEYSEVRSDKAQSSYEARTLAKSGEEQVMSKSPARRSVCAPKIERKRKPRCSKTQERI